MYTVVTFTYYIPPKCVKTREPKDKHCVLWCIYIRENICDPIPLDNLKKHTALPYVTLGLYHNLLLGTHQGLLRMIFTRKTFICFI